MSYNFLTAQRFSEEFRVDSFAGKIFYKCRLDYPAESDNLYRFQFYLIKKSMEGGRPEIIPGEVKSNLSMDERLQNTIRYMEANPSQNYPKWVERAVRIEPELADRFPVLGQFRSVEVIAPEALEQPELVGDFVNP